MQADQATREPRRPQQAAAHSLPDTPDAPPAALAVADTEMRCAESRDCLSSDTAGHPALQPAASLSLPNEAHPDDQMDQAEQVPFLQGLTSDLAGCESGNRVQPPSDCTKALFVASPASESSGKASPGSAWQLCLSGSEAGSLPAAEACTAGARNDGESPAVQQPTSCGTPEQPCQAGDDSAATPIACELASCSVPEQYCQAREDSAAAAARPATPSACERASCNTSEQCPAAAPCTPRQQREGIAAAGQQDGQEPAARQCGPACAAQQPAFSAGTGSQAGPGDADALAAQLHRVLEAGRVLEELVTQMQEANDEVMQPAVR